MSTLEVPQAGLGCHPGNEVDLQLSGMPRIRAPHDGRSKKRFSLTPRDFETLAL
jgi:hypothetical protein